MRASDNNNVGNSYITAQMHAPRRRRHRRHPRPSQYLSLMTTIHGIKPPIGFLRPVYATKYRCTIDQELVNAACCIWAGQTLRVHSSDGSTFLCDSSLLYTFPLELNFCSLPECYFSA